MSIALSNMYEFPVDTLLNPILLFWIALFYLVILFHSFGIPKIWNRINGVELLFLSAMIGYIFYITTISLIFPLINLIKGLIDSFPSTVVSSLSTFQINFTDLGQLFVYLSVTFLVPIISYFIVIFSIYLIIRLIRYCLDPSDDIFSNYSRFVVIKNLKISDTLVFVIPSFVVQISIVCLILGGLVNSIQNIQFSWDIWIILNSTLQVIFLVLCLAFLSFIYVPIIESGSKIVNFLLGINAELNKHVYKSQTESPAGNAPIPLTRLGKFVQQHVGVLIIFCLFCLTLLDLIQYHNGSYSFFESLIIFVFSILFSILILLPQKWVIRFKENVQKKIGKKSVETPPSENGIKNSLNYEFSDGPLKDLNDDQFCRKNFIKSISNMIKNREDPSSVVIGIYGEWGEGKTSTLNFIENDLKTNSTIVCVKFNPWRYNDETQLLRNFFFTLAENLEISLISDREKIGELIGKYATILSPVTFKISDIAEVSPGGVLTNAGKLFSSVELEDLKERIEKILDVTHKKVVIFIDDLDRLDREEIQILLKIVKLSADFRHTFYILAFDEEMVASALSEKYGSGVNATENNENGKRFLEKIIQIPLPLPKINNHVLLNMCFNGVDHLLKNEKIQISDEKVQQFVYQFNLGFFSYLKTPRLVKRYLNTLSLSLPLLKNAINIPDLLLIEAIHVFKPASFLKIREHPEVFLGSEFNTLQNPEDVKKRYLLIWDSVFKNETEFEKENLKRVLSYLFPRTRTLYENMNFGHEWDLLWDKEKKIASKRHLNRYFAYAFPEGDISEEDVKHFLATFGDLSEAQISETIQTFTVDVQSADLFILELRKNIRTLNPDHIGAFVLSMAKKSYLFPKLDIGFKLSPYSQLAAFLHELISEIPETSQKMLLLNSIFSSAEPPSFGFNIIRNFKLKIKAEPSPDGSSPQEIDLNALSNILIERVRKITLDSLISSEDMPLTFYYWSRYGSKEDVESYLSREFASKPDSVIRFLKCYVSKASTIEGPVRGNLMRDSYNAIAKFCDPLIIYNALERLFGDLSNAEYGEDNDIIEEGRHIANQFSYLYHHKEQKTDELTPIKFNQTSNEKADNGDR